jgi:ankyrin repeat protein
MRLRKIGAGALLLCGLVTVAGAADPEPREVYQLIRANKLAELQKLLDGGMAVDLRDGRGTTPLMHAAAIGSTEAVQLLLKAGADVNTKNGLEATALLWGATNPEKARLLVEAGADVNAKSKTGRMPLMMAAGHAGSSETVRLLLNKGADTAAAEVRGTTALLEAVRMNDMGSFRLLVDRKVDVNAGDRFGVTALGYAAGHSNLEMMRELLARGAKVNVSHTRGNKVKNGVVGISDLTPLMVAASRGNAEAVKMLLAAGADASKQDVRGMTALHFAVARDKADPAMVRLLLEKGSDAKLQMRDGDSPVDWARKFGNPKLLAMLGSSAGEKGSATAVRTASSDVAVTPRQAVERAVPLLSSASKEYFRMSGCNGCHHQPLIGMALAAVAKRGLQGDSTVVRDQIALIRSELLGGQEGVLQGMFISIEGQAYALLGMAEQGAPAEPAIDATLSAVVSMQVENGGFLRIPLNRPPIEDSPFVLAALAAKAIDRYMIPAREAELRGRIAKIGRWLAQNKPDAEHERAFQLMGLAWSGSEKSAVERVLGELRKAQRADGGWAQLAGLSSDAYATATALYAMRQAGVVPGRDAAYQKGVRYLLSRQKPDGSWHVASRSPKFQPYFQGGFPYEHDQWISVAATAWAVTALAEVVDSPAATASLAREEGVVWRR